MNNLFNSERVPQVTQISFLLYLDKTHRPVHSLILRTFTLLSQWFFVRSEHELHHEDRVILQCGCFLSEPQGHFYSHENETILYHLLQQIKRQIFTCLAVTGCRGHLLHKGSALKLQPERELWSALHPPAL